MGAAETIPNLPKEFSIPAKRDETETKKMYGNVIRPKKTEVSNLLSFPKPLAMAKTSIGIIIIEIVVKTNNTKIITDKVLLVNFIDCFLLPILFLNIGINAALKAPSAKNLRKILGNENAIIKASPIGPEPKKAANIISLIKPKIRLIKVQKPTVIKLIKKLDLLSIFYHY
tara:strand:- start:2241 stop:2753 length:513 start_codon:yes stop_codon:yes gene_type:complete